MLTGCSIIHSLENLNIDYLILDKPNIALQELKILLSKGYKIIALDSGVREFIHYLIDVLPNTKIKIPNIFSLNFLDFEIKDHKNKILKEKSDIKNVLVGFGGYDDKKLSKQLYESGILEKHLPGVKVFLLKGPGAIWIRNEDFPKWTVIEGKKQIDFDFLNDFDLVISYYGQLVFESLLSGVNVAILDYSKYHNSLSRKLKLRDFGVEFINKKKFEDLFADFSHFNEQFKNALSSLQTAENCDLAKFISSFNIPDKQNCPICNSNNFIVKNRFEDRTYFFCNNCSMTYMYRFYGKIEYSNDYFFKDYKEQYGKTYLEDFEAIKTFSKHRIEFILKKKKQGDLLDIGCAYGPFLSLAKSRGFNSFGIDFNEDAIRYVREELKIDAVAGSFLDLRLDKKFDVVTMWYVIEHFSNLQVVLKKINSMLNIGGVFAFSTPNALGVSGRKNFLEFCKNSPKDHFTLWNHKISDKILRKFGFKLYKLNSTGHHLKRFSPIFSSETLRPVYNFFSKIFFLGDTFEAYLEKVEDMD